MFKVILFEDNIPYANALRDAAYLKGIDITHSIGLEEGMVSIRENPGLYQAIILDGRGWLSEDNPNETDAHIHSAINQITELKARGVFIPYVINTGFFEELADQIQHIDKHIIFDKTHDMEPMFAKLLELINDTPLQKLKIKYPEPFQSFGGKYLPETSLKKLVNLLTWLDERTFNQNYFNTIRDILEEMLKRANAIDSDKFIPTILIRSGQDGRPNIKACDMYLTGRDIDFTKMGGTGFIKAPSRIFPPHIGWLFSSLSTNSQILSHNYTSPVSHYAFQSSVLALIEILIWFREYVDTNYPDVV